MLGEKECVSLLKKCNGMEELKEVHARTLRLGLFCDSFCAANLLAACVLSSWGNMDYASLVFSQIDDPGTFEFNTMIRGYTKDNSFERALDLYVEMLEREKLPDNFTYPFVFKACAGLSLTKLGTQIHRQVFKFGLHNDLFVLNSIINMYGKCGNIEDSSVVFEIMEQKSVASWSALVAVHANLGMCWECLELFWDMMGKGSWRAEESILVSVISACTHLGAIDLGRSIHRYLKRNLSGLNVIVDTSLLDMYIKCGPIEKALALSIRHAAIAQSIVADKGLDQASGLSLVEVKRRVYKFVSQDKSHCNWEEIYEMIHQMEWQLKGINQIHQKLFTM